MHPQRTKPQAERAIKKSISMPWFMLVRATQRQHELLLPSLSDYFQFVVRNDLQTHDSSH